jgi:hypothetical protein
MAAPAPLEAALAGAAETTRVLAECVVLFRQRFSESVPYDGLVFQCELESSARLLQDSVLRLAQSTLREVDAWSTGFVAIDAELNGIEALFQRVKSETGGSLVGAAFRPGAPREPEEAALPYPAVEPLKFPDGPFEMNTAALEGVGHRVADIEAGRPERAPLIAKLPPGAPPPDFWSKSADFFAPAMAVMLTTPDAAYATTFSEFYRFSPVPAFIVEQRKLMEQSMRSG